MPLDPLFAERLRVHRRYLIGQVLGDAKRRLTERWARRPGASATPQDAPDPGAPASQASRPATPGGEAPPAPPASHGEKSRAKHRRDVFAWDRKELADVGTPGPSLRITEHLVPVAGYPDVRVRIYHPDDTDVPPPVCLAFYGGAFRVGGIDSPTTDAAYRRRAAASGVAIAAADYALAPEHRDPTQVEQGWAAWEWLIAHGAEVGVDASRLAVQGTSAGGCLAAAVTLVNRDRAGHPVRLQILEVPVVDLTGRHIDLRPTWAMGVPAILMRRELRSIQHTYLGDPARAREPYASPLRAPSHAGLPPAVILTAEYDALRRNGSAYATALRRAGVPASAAQYAGVTHDIPIFTGALTAARLWEADVVWALRTLHDD
jgi:acetyl esterase